MNIRKKSEKCQMSPNLIRIVNRRDEIAIMEKVSTHHEAQSVPDPHPIILISSFFRDSFSSTIFLTVTETENTQLKMVLKLNTIALLGRWRY